MSERISTALDSLADALENREFERARELADELVREYDHDGGDETRARSRALYASESLSIDSATALDSFIRSEGSTRFARIALVTTVTAIAETHAELADAGELDSAVRRATAFVEELREAEPELEAKRKRSAEIVDRAAVPPSVSIGDATVEERPVPIADETVLTVSVTNSGDERAEGVELEIDAPEAVDVDTETAAVGELTARARDEVDVGVSGAQSGTHAIELAVDSENAGRDVSTVVVRVTDEAETESADVESDDPPWEAIAAGGAATAGMAYLAARLLSADEE